MRMARGQSGHHVSAMIKSMMLSMHSAQQQEAIHDVYLEVIVTRQLFQWPRTNSTTTLHAAWLCKRFRLSTDINLLANFFTFVQNCKFVHSSTSLRLMMHTSAAACAPCSWSPHHTSHSQLHCSLHPGPPAQARSKLPGSPAVAQR